MGFSVSTNISAIAVFIQGILSFFSPCVLPMVPLYIGYLAGGARVTDEDGLVRYRRGKVLLHTAFFVLGVSFAFFLLGFGFTTLGKFFEGNRLLFARVGGILVVLFGLYQLGVFGAGALGRERRLPLRLERMAMNPAVALLFGFTFSFAWTPCVGPALASVLLMASSATSGAVGFALIGVYTLGFVLPFLAVGLFTGALLEFFKKHQKVVQYTVKLGGALLIVMGIMMFTGAMNGVTGYLSGLTAQSPPASSGEPAPPSAPAEEPAPTPAPNTEETEAPREEIPAPDFTLTDQNGETHTLSDYKGKTVFLNFWATWCGPCKAEMPDIQKLYEENGGNAEDLVVLGVANPQSNQYPNNQDKPKDEIIAFLTDGGYTYPTAMDETGEVFGAYGITSFPTTFMIDVNGNVFGYVKGTLTRDIMDDIIQQTLAGSEQK